MNRPTEKQLAYILSLVKGSHESDAYRAIGSVCRMSTSAAKRRATKQDASKTIDHLKQKENASA